MLQYNENGVLQEYLEYKTKERCKSCHNFYDQEIIEQVPGFRDKSYDICPYCGVVNGSSMEVEYTNRKIKEF